MIIENETLTQSQITTIKHAIAVLDKRIISEISDQEVWDWVKDKMLEHNVSFNDAAQMCYDDWGAAEMFGYI